MKTISLSIPEPCSEKWENFTMTNHGGFCGSCSKTVVDFTTASDEEIIAFFQNKPAHACGRFRGNQLKTYSFQKSVSTIHPGFTLLKAGLVSLTLLLVSKPSTAQSISEPVKQETVQQPDNTAKATSVDDERIIKGVVVDDLDNSPIAGVNIVLKGTVVGIATDTDGSFEFPQKLKEGDVLLFSFIGYETIEYRVPKESKDVFEMKLYMDLDMMGTVAVSDPYTEQPSGFRKFWTKVKNLF